MADLASRIAAEKAHVKRTLADLDAAMGRKDLGVVELAAIAEIEEGLPQEPTGTE